jgi:hypothetical protein
VATGVDAQGRGRRRGTVVRVRVTDFYLDSAGPWGEVSSGPRPNMDLLAQLLRAPLPDRTDVEVAVPLAELVHEELERFGTSGGERLDNVEIRDALRTLRAVLTRIGITFDPPFRDHSTFRDHWIREGMAGSGGYAARRGLLNDLFNDLHRQLEDLETQSLSSVLAAPVTAHARLGWPAVDVELNELRRHFANARTPQDYRGVGNDCVHVTEALSRLVYDPAVHLRPGEEEPPVARTKQRLDRYIDDALPGLDNAPLRRLAKAAIEVAQQIKHSSDPTRTEAGIAADAVILLANMLRRLAEPT